MPENFYILPGTEVTASEMLEGPPDAENQVFSIADQPYALGDRVWGDGNVYRSLVSNNSAALSDVASWENEGPVDQGALKWVAGTYATGTYKVHNSKLWQSAIDGNNTEPSAGSDDWTDRGPTNRFKAFDTFLDDSTEWVTGITFELDIPSRVTQIVILKPVGAQFKVTVTSASAGMVYQKTFRASRDSGGRWWNYFNAPVRQVGAITVQDLPPYSDATIRIEIAAAEGLPVGVGQIVLGFGEAKATVTTGTGVGMESNSVKDTNAFGRPIIVGYPPSKTVSFAIRMPAVKVDDFAETMFEREAQPTAFFMRDGGPYGAVVYGLFEDFYVDHHTRVRAQCVVTIKGFS